MKPMQSGLTTKYFYGFRALKLLLSLIQQPNFYGASTTELTGSGAFAKTNVQKASPTLQSSSPKFLQFRRIS